MDEVKTRGAGLLAVAAGIASVALLGLHPGGGASDFAGMLKEEAGSRLMDGVVHGGFIVVLALESACYAILTAKLGWRLGAVAGLALFAAGAAALSESMLFDGLVTPALAARYLPHPDRYDAAKPLFALVGTLISILMPLGLAFQSAAIASWGAALIGGGKRAAGVLGVALGIALLAGSAINFAAMNPLILMAGIVGTAAWAIASGVLMFRERV